ncbi:PAS domain S-box protein [Candidatus Kapabacteria bacterium]|nr:PAS domain S-box protein [Candidatus Kapabacteria bacterium]
MLEQIFDSSNDIVIILDESNLISYANTSFCQLIGENCDSLVNKNFDNYISEHDLNKADSISASIISSLQSNKLQSIILLTKSGKRVLVEWSFNTYNKSILAIGRVFKNSIISDSGVYNKIKDGLVVHDKNGAIIEFNQSALDILGVTSDQLLGNTSFDPRWGLKNSEGEDLPPEKSPSVISQKTGKPQKNVILRVQKSNIEQTWIKIQSEPIFEGDDTEPSKVIVTFTDISKEKLNQNIIDVILSSLEYSTSQNYLDTLLENVAKFIKADHCFIGQYLGDSISTKSYWNNEIKENFNYDLEYTPCEISVAESICCISSDVTKMFPKDQMLIDLNIESYLGATLKNNKNETVGIFVALFERELENPDYKIDLMKMFSNRATLELERLIYEKEIIESKNFQNTLYNSIPNPIFVKDINLNYTDCNVAFSEYFGKSKEEIIGKNVFELYPKYLAVEYQAKDKELLESSSGKQNYEWFIKTDNGIRNVIFNKSVILDANNDVTGILGVVLDITDSKEKSKKIESSERLFRSMFEKTEVGIALTNEMGAINIVNDAFAEFLGYSNDELVGLNFKDFTHKDHIEYESQFINRLLKGEPFVNYDKQYIRKDKQVVWGNLTLSSLLDEDGNITGFIGNIIDINKTKINELLLQQSEKKYGALFENINDGIVILENDVFIDCNSKAIKILKGDDKNLIIGKKPSDISPNEFTNKSYLDLVQANDNKENLKIVNWKHTATNGTNVELEISISTFEFNEQKLVLAVWRDITDREILANRLIHKNKQLEQYFGILDQQFIVSTSAADGTIIDVNQNYEDISGYSYNDIVGNKHRNVNSGFHPSDFWKSLWEKLTQGKIWRGEIKNRNSDGQYYWIDTVIYPQFDAEKNITYFLEISTDITLSKTYEIELENKVEKRTQELELINEEKDFLLSMLGHDLKNPLSAIYLQLSVIESHANKKSDGNLAIKARNSLKIAKGMDQLITNILELNEVENSSIIMNSSKINLVDVLKDSISSFRPLLKSKNQTIIRNFEDDDTYEIYSDQQYLRQILDNIISNAIKYSNKDNEINIDIYNSDSEITLKIKDSGIGIKENEIGKIFKKFNKLSNKPTDGESSTGLGLAIVKRLCDILKYELNVESEYGVGTTFTITFPV